MLTEKEVDKLRKVISNFDVVEEDYEFYLLKRGNINKTDCAISKNSKKYILQKINNYVFKKPEKLIRNIKEKFGR